MATASYTVHAMSQIDNDIFSCTLFSEVADTFDGKSGLEAIPSSGALLEHDDLSVDNFSQTFKTGDIQRWWKTPVKYLNLVTFRGVLWSDIIDLISFSLLEDSAL